MNSINVHFVPSAEAPVFQLASVLPIQSEFPN